MAFSSSVLRLIGALLLFVCGVHCEHVQYRLRRGEIPSRGVNLGSWLVAEHWMSYESPLWDGVPKDIALRGEYATMQFLGDTRGYAAFEKHRAMWITEADIKVIADAKLNLVRVPVGFWITNDYRPPSTDNIPPSRPQEQVYARGAMKYLDRLITKWSVKYNVAVMLSLHAHKGSQNGFDHSSLKDFGSAIWSNSQANVDNSVKFATFLANRYKNSPAFLGMNLMNEPHYPTNPETVKSYYTRTYNKIRATGNDCVLAVSPMLTEQGAGHMIDFMRWPAYYNVWHEFHKYYIWGLEGASENNIMDAVRSYRYDTIDAWQGNWLLVGEWCMDSTASAPFESQESFRAFGKAQLEGYNRAHSGWTFWSWRHSDELTKRSGWSMRQLLKDGDLVL
uniref:glucan 1,3-beta-glucosidase n=1 Tax=Globisporangium ultimum (strain ATCC 200006 / CBS 805.95 / DAOM BR144) TaxID=431595 RepID=K3W954_GLOUD